jgi:hypothetical protein
MKKYNVIFLCLLFTCFTNVFYSQSPIQDNRSKNQPILIDDTHAESLKLAELKLTAIPPSALKTINDLTERQIKCISMIEKCRDKKLTKTNNKLVSYKIRLTEFQLDENKNQLKINRTLNMISKLAICYKNTISKSSQKIRSKLTQKQQVEFDKTGKSVN